MDIYGGEVNRLIEELGRTSGYRSKDSTETGIPHNQYAGGTCAGTGRFNRKCKEEDKILQ